MASRARVTCRSCSRRRPRNRFHQAYPGRGGDLDCEAKGDRVILRGQAVTVMESRLRL